MITYLVQDYFSYPELEYAPASAVVTSTTIWFGVKIYSKTRKVRRDYLCWYYADNETTVPYELGKHLRLLDKTYNDYL